MNYREKFISRINQYEVVQNQLKAEAELFSKDDANSEDDVKDNLKKLEAGHQKELKTLKTDLQKILSDKRTELGNPIEANLDKDYQLRLKNLLIVFKRSGLEMTRENIVKGIVLFKDDPIALAPLKDALIEAGRDQGEVDELMPLQDSDVHAAKLFAIEHSLDNKLKLTLKSKAEDNLGYESILNILDEDFNYIA